MVSNNNEGKLSILTGDTMLIQIIDSTGLVKEREVLHYGIKDSIGKEIQGKFMNIKKWEVNQNASAIDLSIHFKRNSNSFIFQIYFIDASSKKLLQKKLNNLSLAKRIYESTIKLFSPSKLELTINSNVKNYSEWKINDTIVAICRAYDGIPIEIPIFENYQKFKNIENTLSLERNERKTSFNVRLSNHLTTLRCVAGQTSKTHLIKVLHHPTKLYFKPKINFILQPNTTIYCYVKDGYPVPKVEWHFIEGPLNSSQFYEISSNGSQLHINKKCPIKSKWIFICLATHIIRNSKRKLNETFSFLVENNTTKYCDIECMNIKLLNLEYFMNNIGKSFSEMTTNQNRNKLETKSFVSKMTEIEQYSNISFNELKKENIKLKQRIKLFEQNKNAEINELNNKIKQINRYLMKLIRKGNSCIYGNHFGEIKTKGQNGEIHEWIIKGFRKIQKERYIFSPLFYSFYWGYDIVLIMNPKGFGSGMGSHMSLHFTILPGKFDDFLPWPMRHEIKFSLKNQMNGNSYFPKTLHYDTVVPRRKVHYQRPTSCGSSRVKEIGHDTFISLVELNKEEFLFNDSVVVICEVIKK